MLSFKQYILEVTRSKERAAKLGDYLVKRENKRSKANRDVFHLPAWHHMHKPGHEHDLEDTDKDTESFSKAYTYAHSVFKKRKKNVVDVPVKDLLKRNWQGVNFDGKYALKAKDHGFQDKRPINVARSRETGKMEMIDGFHRLASHWLQGKTHVKANVQDVGRGKKKK